MKISRSSSFSWEARRRRRFVVSRSRIAPYWPAERFSQFVPAAIAVPTTPWLRERLGRIPKHGGDDGRPVAR